MAARFLVASLLGVALGFVMGWVASRVNEERKFWKAMADVQQGHKDRAP